MAVVQSLTAPRMLAIEAASVVDGEVRGDNLILIRHDGGEINAGNVRGLTGPPQVRNKFLNSRFLVNQRYFDYKDLVINTRTLGPDRWEALAIGAAGWVPAKYSIEAAVPGALPESDPYFLRLDTSMHHTSSDALAYIQQRIENVRTLSGTTAVVSFWAKVNTQATQKVAVHLVQYMGTGGSAPTYPAVGTVTVTKTWTRYSLVVNIPTLSGKTIDDKNSYLGVRFYATAGSSNSAIGIGTQLDKFDFWGFQLEEGSTASPLYRAAYAADLAACQRYYWTNYLPNAGTQYSWIGACNGAAKNVHFNVQFPVAMRALPSIIGTVSSVQPSDGFVGSAFSVTPAFDTISYEHTTNFPGMTVGGNGGSGTRSAGQAIIIAGSLAFSAEL